MLRFFRNIRQKLIVQDNVRKYSLYAVGEIFLVVIGILIALQVNNWNEERINQKKITAYLSEMSENLEYDIENIDEGFKFIKEQDSALTESINSLIDGSSDRKIATVLAKNAFDLSFFYIFEIKSVAYDNLIASGNIDLLGDPELRNELTAYYQKRFEIREGTQRRIAELVRSYTDLATPIILNRETIEIIMNLENKWPEQISITQEHKAELLSTLFTIHDNMKSQKEQFIAYRKNAELLKSKLIVD